jgi:ligand-binding sensor domain-containing protein/anti-sigma regulatory factor (Ser/Thr protein kinase)
MWFCTDAGVCRYDGYSFHTYSAENGLPDNTVFGAFEDAKGRIWFRSMSGKLSYLENDRIISIEANKAISLVMKNSIVSSLYVDSGDTVWCGMLLGKGYFKIAPPYHEPNFTFYLQPHCSAYLLDIDGTGFVWGMNSAPQSIERPEKWFLLRSKQGVTNYITGPDLMRPQTVVARTQTRGFAVTGESEISFLKATSSEHYIVPLYPLSFYEDRQMGVWMGYNKNGVFFYAHGDLHCKKPLHYLKGLSVTSIHQDNEGGLWFTTLENGIYYMSSAGLLYFDKENGLQDNKVLTILPRDSVSVYAGTAVGTIDVVDEEKISPLASFHKKPGQTYIYKLLHGLSNSLLVGSNFSSILEQKPPNKNIIVMEGNSMISVKCYAYTKRGDLWAGNYLNLFRIDPKSGQVLQKIATKSRILSMYCSKTDEVWLGCVNGLWKYANSALTYLGDSLPIFKNRIEDIQEAPDGTCYFATKDIGLIIKKGGNIVNLTKKMGLPSNTCKSVCLDKNGMLWVGTNKGICKLIEKRWGDYTCETYSASDGLLSNEINQVVRTGNYLWAATNQGIVFFDVTQPLLKKTPPPVYLTGLTINNDKKELKNNFELKYFENYIHISFIGLSYKRNAGLEYKYKLKGLDSTWNYTSNLSIQYTTLPHGNYTFIVYAIGYDGSTSAKPAMFNFSIALPFWSERWFIGLVTALTLTLIVLIIRQRLKILKAQAIKSAEVSRRIAEMELKALKAQMNPHFIFNCIASIQHFIWKNNPEEADRYLSKFSKLIRNVLINSTHEYITLEVELQTLGLYIELERLRFSSKFEYKFILEEGLPQENLLIPPLIIQPYVENAIWHGLMHLENKTGELTIRVETKDGFLKCIVDDNGIGRKKSLEIKGAKKHRSVGLSITKERLENLNALYQSNLSVQLIDKYNEHGEGTGTTVEIFIPLNIQR